MWSLKIKDYNPEWKKNTRKGFHKAKEKPYHKREMNKKEGYFSLSPLLSDSLAIIVAFI